MVGDQLGMIIAMEQEREKVIQIFEDVRNLALSKIDSVPVDQIIEHEQIAILKLPFSNASNQYR